VCGIPPLAENPAAPIILFGRKAILEGPKLDEYQILIDFWLFFVKIAAKWQEK